MWQQAGALQHQLAHRCKVIEGACVTLAFQKFSRLRENPLGLVPQTNQRFLAPGAAPLFREREHFVRGHEMRAGLPGIFPEGAVAAIVAAERRQRNENFLREADGVPFSLLAHRAGRFEQFV